MYEEYFGLKRKPFSIVPDPACFYLSGKHREALAHLLYGAGGEGGFILLTGEVGTGKTTVCRRLFELMPEGVDVAFVLNPKLTSEELLATICDEFGIGCPEGAMSVRTLVARINDYLLDAHHKGRRAVLVIEEAQNLTPEVLEQVRLLTNLETNQRKLLQVIMIGQPELKKMLAKPELRQLSQRITARYHLGPLSKGEVSEYLAYRLAAAGAGRNRLFPPATMRKIYGLTKGIPRLINVICDRALLGTFVQEKEFVDVPTLKRAAQEVIAEEEGKGRGKVFYAAAGALVLLCVVLAGLSYAPLWRQWFFAGARAPVVRSLVDSKATLLSTKPPPPTRAAVEPQREVSLTPAAAEPQKEAPVEKAPLSPPPGKSGPSTREMAYRALLRQWRAPYGPDSRPVCEQAESGGLTCLYGQGSVGDLAEMNKPAVLRFTDGSNGSYYALLIGLDEKTATLLLGDEKKTVDVAEVAKQWSGDYLILWRAPPGYQGRLRLGDRGPAVAWLEKQLALAQGKPAPTEEQDVFDATVTKQVKEFQRAVGMAPLGIAGPRTIMRLCDARPDNRDPVLRRSGSGKEVR